MNYILFFLLLLFQRGNSDWTFNNNFNLGLANGISISSVMCTYGSLLPCSNYYYTYYDRSLSSADNDEFDDFEIDEEADDRQAIMELFDRDALSKGEGSWMSSEDFDALERLITVAMKNNKSPATKSEERKSNSIQKNDKNLVRPNLVRGKQNTDKSASSKENAGLQGAKQSKSKGSRPTTARPSNNTTAITKSRKGEKERKDASIRRNDKNPVRPNLVRGKQNADKSASSKENAGLKGGKQSNTKGSRSTTSRPSSNTTTAIKSKKGDGLLTADQQALFADQIAQLQGLNNPKPTGKRSGGKVTSTTKKPKLPNKGCKPKINKKNNKKNSKKSNGSKKASGNASKKNANPKKASSDSKSNIKSKSAQSGSSPKPSIKSKAQLKNTTTSSTVPPKMQSGSLLKQAIKPKTKSKVSAPASHVQQVKNSKKHIIQPKAAPNSGIKPIGQTGIQSKPNAQPIVKPQVNTKNENKMKISNQIPALKRVKRNEVKRGHATGVRLRKRQSVAPRNLSLNKPSTKMEKPSQTGSISKNASKNAKEKRDPGKSNNKNLPQQNRVAHKSNSSISTGKKAGGVLKSPAAPAKKDKIQNGLVARKNVGNNVKGILPNLLKAGSTKRKEPTKILPKLSKHKKTKVKKPTKGKKRFGKPRKNAKKNSNGKKGDPLDWIASIFSLLGSFGNPMTLIQKAMGVLASLECTQYANYMAQCSNSYYYYYDTTTSPAPSTAASSSNTEHDYYYYQETTIPSRLKTTTESSYYYSDYSETVSDECVTETSEYGETTPPSYDYYGSETAQEPSNINNNKATSGPLKPSGSVTAPFNGVSDEYSYYEDTASVTKSPAANSGANVNPASNSESISALNSAKVTTLPPPANAPTSQSDYVDGLSNEPSYMYVQDRPSPLADGGGIPNIPPANQDVPGSGVIGEVSIGPPTVAPFNSAPAGPDSAGSADTGSADAGLKESAVTGSAEAGSVDSGSSDAGLAESSVTGSADAESLNAEPTDAAPSNDEQADTGLVNTEPTNAESVNVESTDAGSENIASDTGSTSADSADAGSANVEATDAGSINADSVDAGAENAGSVTADSAGDGSIDAGSADASAADSGIANDGSVDDGASDTGA